MAGAAAEVPGRVGDRHRRAERVAAEDHLAAAAARALDDLAQVLERELQPPLADVGHRGAGDGRERLPADRLALQVVAEGAVRVAGREAGVVLERLRAPVVGPHLQALDAADDLRADEREVARAALEPGHEDQHALGRRGAEALVAHAVVARRARPGRALDRDHRAGGGGGREEGEDEKGEQRAGHGAAPYCSRRERRCRHTKKAITREHEQPRRGRAGHREDPLGDVAERVDREPGRARPEDAAERVPEQERRPAHLVHPRQPRRGDPQPRHPAPEEDRLGPVLREERLALLEHLQPVLVERARPLEQLAAAVAPDREADVVPEDRGRGGDRRRAARSRAARRARAARRRSAPSRPAPGSPSSRPRSARRPRRSRGWAGCR